MSITAEKIEEALAYLESEYSIKECCGHPVGGNGPEDEPACCAQPDLYLRSDKVKETILSLLQQGEPEGWRLVPKKPTEKMRQRGGEYNCPTISLTSASNYAVDVYTAMLEVAPIFPVLVSEPNDTANHDRADHVGRTGGSIPPTGAMLSASPLPPAPGAETDAALEEAYQEGFEAGKIEGRDDAIMVDKDLFRMLSNWVFDKTGTSWSDFPDGLSPHDLIDMLDEHLRCSSQPAVLEEAHPVWRGDVRCAPELGGCWIDDQGKCQHCGFQYERKK